VSPLPERLWDAVRVHKYNESEGLVRLPWAEPTLIGRDCSGLPEFGASGTSDGGFWGWLGRWAGRLLTPTELRATTFAGVPKGIGGMGGSFSDFGGAVPEITEPLVFTSDRDGDWDIYAMSIDSSEVHQLTDDPSADTGPAISPDGQTIAFVSDRAGSLDIWTMSTTGVDLQRITTSEHPDSAPAWSPDGTRIAFQRSTGEGPHRIFIVDADGSAETEFLIGHKPAWSPDGTRLAFAAFGGSEPTYADVFVAFLDGSGLTNITNHDANDTDPAWSPDGSRVAFMSTRNGNHDVFVMNADGSDPTNLTATSAYIDYRPDWSPDGTTIAFVSRRTGNADVWTMTPTGQVLRNMTNHPANDVEVALRTASATPPVVVVVDGVLSPGEWDQADHYAVDITLPNSQTTTADIYIINDATDLLMAVRFNTDISTWGTNIGVRIDEDGSGSWDGGDHTSPYGEDGWVAQDHVDPEADRFFDEFFNTGMSTPQGQDDVDYGGAVDGSMASGSDGLRTVIEMSHPLASGDASRDAQLSPGASAPFLLLINLPQSGPTEDHRFPASGFMGYTVR
jgi:Tol biopolymer transport system component